jgi:hypothetical protein
MVYIVGRDSLIRPRPMYISTDNVDIVIISDIRFTRNQPTEISNPEIMKVCNEVTLESSVVVSC